ncbi:hypothetical protein WMY93_031669 [Mugilogobius chulae]|uniref:Uncharacterized protein n=1 Tax=Mugilogobius chulae TaxID=88201 RepID=A0AAW0MD34_9GOBI
MLQSSGASHRPEAGGGDARGGCPRERPGIFTCLLQSTVRIPVASCSSCPPTAPLPRLTAPMLRLTAPALGSSVRGTQARERGQTEQHLPRGCGAESLHRCGSPLAAQNHRSTNLTVRREGLRTLHESSDAVEPLWGRSSPCGPREPDFSPDRGLAGLGFKQVIWSDWCGGRHLQRRRSLKALQTRKTSHE